MAALIGLGWGVSKFLSRVVTGSLGWAGSARYDPLRNGSGDNMTQDEIKRQFPLM